MAYEKKPCLKCPFRTNAKKIGQARMKKIIENSSHQCVKVGKLQCAGHMLMTKEQNAIMRWLYSWGLRAKLSGQELIFKDKNSCITYHKTQEDAELELHDYQTPGEDDLEPDFE